MDSPWKIYLAVSLLIVALAALLAYLMPERDRRGSPVASPGVGSTGPLPDHPRPESPRPGAPRDRREPTLPGQPRVEGEHPSVATTPSEHLVEAPEELAGGTTAAPSLPPERQAATSPSSAGRRGAPPSTAPRVAAPPRGRASVGAGAVDTLTVLPQGSRVDADPQTSETRESAERREPPVAAAATPGPAVARDVDRSPPTSTPRVVMVPSASALRVGDRVQILVTIDAATDVGHTPFHVIFNPAVLRFVAGDEGSFLASDGRPTAFFATTSQGGASVVVGLSRLGRVPGVSGAGDLCVLHFDVVGAGPAGLAFSRAKVRDSSNRIVPAIFEAASLNAT